MNELTVKIKKLGDGAIAPTFGSEFAAGADLYSAEETLTVAPGETKLIGTKLAMAIPEGKVGLIYARSGLSVKKGLAPANKVGVIDSDYFNAENEGHIFIKMTNCGDKILTVEKGKAFAQGVFLPFGITESDACEITRVGGFGSTDKAF